jgi:hypothetical protein
VSFAETFVLAFDSIFSAAFALVFVSFLSDRDFFAVIVFFFVAAFFDAGFLAAFFGAVFFAAGFLAAVFAVFAVFAGFLAAVFVADLALAVFAAFVLGVAFFATFERPAVKIPFQTSNKLRNGTLTS